MKLSRALTYLLPLCVALLFVPHIGAEDLAETPAAKNTPAGAKHAPRRLPGQQRGGMILLPNQWSLRPAGKQLTLGDFPVNIGQHPKLPYSAILHSGYGEHEIITVDLKRDRIVARVPLADTFYGICFDPAGERLFVSGGVSETIHQYKFADGLLSEHRVIALGGDNAADAKTDTHIPAGISCNGDGSTLFVCNAWGNTVAVVPLAEPTKLEHLPLDAGSYPYTSVSSKDGARLFVSLWGEAAVKVLDLKTRKFVATWSTRLKGSTVGGDHPTEMALSPDGALLYVACANSNTVVVLDTTTGQPLEVISSALYPAAPIGSTPNSISLSSDGKVLLVANADNNNLAVFDVTARGKARSLGFIPTGWYPTSVRFGIADDRIYVTNGKGIVSKPNPQGPNPQGGPPKTVEQYIGGLFDGTLSIIEPPSPQQMAIFSKHAYECSPLAADNAPVLAGVKRSDDNPIPAKVGDSSPIKHCIYIIKENRTYDQVLGDMKQGNGDPALCIFPERVTPNHHALAREFVLLDNFYVESEVSADGHEWSMAAYATDFVERTWPLNYRARGKSKVGYPGEGAALGIAPSAGGYIWDRCKEAGVTYRSYGEFVRNGAKPGDPATTNIKNLEGHFDPLFRSYDLDYPDVKRTDRFIEELARFEKEGRMPQFIVLRLPNDHTYGTTVGKLTPTAMVADNDLAFGRLVEAVSNSKFWKETAIFVVEDDAQNGSDHVDAHRTIAYVISPYTKRKFVDSTMYSTSSMLRTMELILGLKPMSQFDAAATPMYQSFSGRPDLTPFRHRVANVDLEERNKPGAWGAAESAKLDFSREDAADDLLLNDIVWRSVRGADSPMPPPVRTSFVRVLPEED